METDGAFCEVETEVFNSLRISSVKIRPRYESEV